MKPITKLLSILVLILGIAPQILNAQSDTRTEDGLPPMMISGTYNTTYYAPFRDWQIFPVLIPMKNAIPSLRYEERFDLNQAGQIIGSLRGEVANGTYSIPLPGEPAASAWFDTDGDPATPSKVKVFLAGIGNGVIGDHYITRYDFVYTRSFRFDPTSHLWEGQLVVWSAEDGATFPILNGDDNIYYTPDDVMATVPAGWSVVEVKAKAALGRESVRVYHTSEPIIQLSEPRQLSDVDLSALSYSDAFQELINHLEQTYIFTEYRQVDWEALRQQFAPRAEQVTTPQEFQQLLQDSLFTFRDGHLSIFGAGVSPDNWGVLGMHVFPVDGELMVVDTYTNSPIGLYSEIVPGTVILEINDQDAMTYFQNTPRSIYSNGHEIGDLWRRGEFVFRAEPGTYFRLTYRLPDGRVSRTALSTVLYNEVSDNDPNIPAEAVYYRILDSGIGVIGIRNFTSAFIDDRWNEAMQAMLAANVSGIIIDLRYNSGGFSGISNYLLGDFLDEDIYSGREISALDEDGDGKFDIEDEFYYGRKRVFDPARVAVMIGPDCYSACEFAALAFQDIGATVVGHLPSGGAGGGVGASYLLPGETLVYGMAVVRSEDPEGNITIEGTGVQLDIQVPFTAQGLASGEDLVLKAAEEWLLSR
jgi:C-terminal processing protease CtpA/Prc